MKKGIASLLVLVMILGIFVLPVSVSAAEEDADDGYGITHVLYGDINYDRTIGAADALIALKKAVGKVTLDEHHTAVADVDANEKIDAADALMILKLSVGKLKVFPVGETYLIGDEIIGGDSIATYNKSNSVNGAYEKDPTADTSFVSDQGSLASNTIYQLNSGVAPDNDTMRLVYSLQGIINRDFGMDAHHTSLIYVTRDLADTDWLNYITEKGSIMYVADAASSDPWMVKKSIAEWKDFYAEFKDIIKSCGIILWDGNVPATANVAATICGLDGYLPVLAESPLHKQLVEDGVEVKMSLVDMFENGKKGEKIVGTNIESTGSAKNDAYLWALEKYFNRCSSTYLAYTLDGASTIKGYDAYEDNPIASLDAAGSTCLSNHDYLIARRCFFFDLAVYKEEAACDDPAQKNGQADIGTDNATMLKIYEARYKRANGTFGQLLGFPPWWLKYTTHNSQGSKVETWIEWLYCEYITCYNLAKEADAAQPSSMLNGSVYYKYVPKTKEYQNNRNKETIQYDKNTFYYTIYVGDYDSSAWLKQHIHSMWMKRGGDRNRGKIALMWSINPNLSYRVPMVFDYMYEEKTDLDYFAGGDGGAGYIIPEGLFHDKALAYTGEKRPAENADGGQAWADYCKTFYKRFDLDITGFVINGANYKVSKNIASTMNQFSPVGSFTNCMDTPLGKYQGVPYVYCQNGVADTTDPSVLYSHAKTATMKNAGVNFSAYRTICATPTQIKRIVTNFDDYAAQKGLLVKYCDPYTYFDVLAQSGQGTEIQ